MRIKTPVRVHLGPHNRVYKEHEPLLKAQLQAVLDQYLIGPAVALDLDYGEGRDSSKSRRPTQVELSLGEHNALPNERVDSFKAAVQAALDRYVSGPAVQAEFDPPMRTRQAQPIRKAA